MVAMVRMSEEDPYVFLASSENVGFPNDFLRFSANPSRYVFFDNQKPWFSIDFTRFSAFMFFDMFSINGP